MMTTSEVISAVETPNQLVRWARNAPDQLLQSLRELPRTIAQRSEQAAADAANAAGALVGWTAQALHDGPFVAASWSGTLWNWFVNVNRNRIVQFARDRYPNEFAELEGSDVRILDWFVEPDPLSNTLSLLGPPLHRRAPWLPFVIPDSELHLGVEPWNALGFLRDTGGPLTPYGNSEVLGDGRGKHRWFFINGILTNRDLALRNAARLNVMFGRDVVTIYNSTQGLIPDLVASALQKFTNINTEPVAFALIQIARALLDPEVERVVVVAHSRGTIIMGDVLDLIYCAIDPKYLDRTNMNPRDLEVFQQRSFKTAQSYEVQAAVRALKGREDAVCEKLELYLFANAASKVSYLDEEQRRPHIESFANEHDIVTRLGCLAREEFHAQQLLRIDGPVYLRRGAYGHLLNALPARPRGGPLRAARPAGGTRALRRGLRPPARHGQPLRPEPLVDRRAPGGAVPAGDLPAGRPPAGARRHSALGAPGAARPVGTVSEFASDAPPTPARAA